MVASEREHLRICEIQERLFYLAQEINSADLMKLANDLELIEIAHPELVDVGSSSG